MELVIIMSNAYHYQNTFDDALANEFRAILGLSPYAGQEVGLLLCGDSITNANMSKTSTTAHKENNGIITTLNVRMQQRFKLIDVFDQGVGGETAQMRVSSLTDYTTVTSRHPEIKAAVEAYGRNDISAGRTAVQVVADRQTIITHLLTLVGLVFVESIKPSDYGSLTIEKNQEAMLANAALQNWCASDARLHFVNTYDVMGNESGLDAGNSYDGIHLTAQSAWRASGAYVPVMSMIFGMGEDYSVANNVLLLNPPLAGSGGTLNSGTSGVVAAGWDAKYSGGTLGITRTFSKTPQDKQRVEIQANASAGSTEITYFQQTLSSGFVVGEVYRVRAKLKVNSIARGYWVGVQVLQRDATQAIIHNATDYDQRDQNALLDGAAMAGQRIFLQPMDFIIQANTVTIDIRIAMAVTAAGQSASMDIEIEQVVLEKITLDLLVELGGRLIFWMDPDAQNTFVYDTDTNRVTQINDRSYAGNHATVISGFEGAWYDPATSQVSGQPTLKNASATADTTKIGYRFAHDLTLTTPRTLIAVARGDVSVVEPAGESASNALFAASNGVNSTDSLCAIRQVYNDQRRHQLTGYGYGSSYGNPTLDALRSYWMRYDGVNVDGGVNATISKGPAAANTSGLTQDTHGYLFSDGNSNNSYIGWMRDVLLFNTALTATELSAVLLFIRSKSNVTADQ